MIRSQYGWKTFEKEIFYGRSHRIHSNVKLININFRVFVKFLEQEINVGPIARNPVKAFGVQPFFLDEGDGLA